MCNAGGVRRVTRVVQACLDMDDVGVVVGADPERQGVPRMAVRRDDRGNAGLETAYLARGIPLHLAPEAGVVRDDEAEVADLRPVDARPVDLVEDAVADREPDAAGEVRRPDGVLLAARPGGRRSGRSRRVARRVRHRSAAGVGEAGRPAGACCMSGAPTVTAAAATTGSCHRSPAREDPGRRVRAPRSGLVLVQRGPVVEDPVDHAPRGLHGVLAREERLVALRGVADEALVRRALGPALVARVELHALADHRLPGLLGAAAERDGHVGREAEPEVVRVGWLGLAEDRLGRALHLDEDLGRGHRQALAGPQVERHAAPAPGVDAQAQRRERLHRGRGSDTLHRPVAAVLAAHDVARRDRADGVEHLELLVADRFRRGPRWRLHGEEAHDLEEVVLDDIADRPRPVVERPARRHIERLGHVHLDTRDVITVPEGLQERVREPEVEEILDRLLAQVMVDAEDRGLREDPVDGRVQRPCARQVPPERLLQDDPRTVRASRGGEVRDHLGEERRRDGEVVERVPGLSELAAKRMEGLDVVVRALDVAQPRGERLDGRPVDRPGRSDAPPGPLPQALEVARPGDADDRHVEALVADQPEEGGEDLLEGEVSRRAEEHERVRSLGGHSPAPVRAGRAPCGRVDRHRPGIERHLRPPGGDRIRRSTQERDRPGLPAHRVAASASRGSRPCHAPAPRGLAGRRATRRARRRRGYHRASRRRPGQPAPSGRRPGARWVDLRMVLLVRSRRGPYGRLRAPRSARHAGRYCGHHDIRS